MYRRNGRGRVLLLVFLILSILIITIDFRGDSGGPLEKVKDISQAIVAPIQRGITTVTRPVGNFFSSLADLADLRQENKNLKAEVEKLRTEVTQARDLADENAELRDNLELDESWVTMDRVAAQVVANAPNNYRWAVLIDKGSADGVRKNMAVINPDGLVGKITQVSHDTATVLLLIDPNGAAACTVRDQGLTGVVNGSGEGQPLEMQFVDKDANIAVGDDVLTSNYNAGVFPPGIPIGRVQDIGGDTRAAELDIKVEPYVDFDKLNVLEILLDTGRSVASKDDS